MDRHERGVLGRGAGQKEGLSSDMGGGVGGLGRPHLPRPVKKDEARATTSDLCHFSHMRRDVVVLVQVHAINVSHTHL